MPQSHYNLARLSERAAQNRLQAIKHSQCAERLIPVDTPAEPNDQFLRTEKRPDGYCPKGEPILVEYMIFASSSDGSEYYRVTGSSSGNIHRVAIPKSVIKPLQSKLMYRR